MKKYTIMDDLLEKNKLKDKINETLISILSVSSTVSDICYGSKNIIEIENKTEVVKTETNSEIDADFVYSNFKISDLLEAIILSQDFYLKHPIPTKNDNMRPIKVKQLDCLISKYIEKLYNYCGLNDIWDYIKDGKLAISGPSLLYLLQGVNKNNILKGDSLFTLYPSFKTCNFKDSERTVSLFCRSSIETLYKETIFGHKCINMKTTGNIVYNKKNGSEYWLARTIPKFSYLLSEIENIFDNNKKIFPTVRIDRIDSVLHRTRADCYKLYFTENKLYIWNPFAVYNNITRDFYYSSMINHSLYLKILDSGIIVMNNKNITKPPVPNFNRVEQDGNEQNTIVLEKYNYTLYDSENNIVEQEDMVEKLKYSSLYFDKEQDLVVIKLNEFKSIPNSKNPYERSMEYVIRSLDK